MNGLCRYKKVNCVCFQYFTLKACLDFKAKTIIIYIVINRFNAKTQLKYRTRTPVTIPTSKINKFNRSNDEYIWTSVVQYSQRSS